MPSAGELTPFSGQVAPMCSKPTRIAGHITALAGEPMPTSGNVAPLVGQLMLTDSKPTALRSHFTAMDVRGNSDTRRGDLDGWTDDDARRGDHPDVASHDRDDRTPDLDNGTGDPTRQIGSSDD